jgi:hypothetical protein
MTWPGSSVHNPLMHVIDPPYRVACALSLPGQLLPLGEACVESRGTFGFKLIRPLHYPY